MNSSLSRASTTQAIQATRPTYSYAEHTPPPTVHYITSPNKLNDALNDFEGPYGFDCEYKPFPVPGRTALVQLSNATKILLIQVSAFPAFPESLKAILEDPSVKKIGHYTESDGAKLRDDYGILPKGLINLMPLARQVDPNFLVLHPPVRNVTLAEMVLFYLNRTLPKGHVRVSNWELNPLTRAQQEYAASDAYCAYEVYTRLIDMQEQNESKLDHTKYTINIEPRTSPLPKPRPLGRDYLNRNNRKLTNFEFDAYTLWYHGYTVTDILQTLCAAFPMSRMRGYFDGEDAIIAFIVAALRKDTSLPFNPIALRAMVNADDTSRDAYRTFVKERCPEVAPESAPSPVQSTAKTEAAPLIGRKRKASTSEDDEDRTVERLREATPEYTQNERAPAVLEGMKAVKRSRTI
ncbi:ribonuclease H-like protein [Peniophora sp. CONT]|nr:ribonuclease H-like protein [Peniophora sp. CONT]